MLVCKVIEVWQDFLSEYVDRKFTYICYRRLIIHEWIYYDSKNCVIYNSYKIAVFTYHSPHFCFPWRRPCDYNAICCMDGKTIQCLPNALQQVPIYLQQFPSYTMLKSMRKSKNRYFYHISVSPWDAPGAITLNVVWMKREFDTYKLPRSMCPSKYNRFWDTYGILSYPLHSTPPLLGFPSEYRHPLWFWKTRMVSLSDGEKNFEDIFIRFGATPERDGQTDGRTDTGWRQ